MSASPKEDTRVAIREAWGTAFTIDDDLFRIRLTNSRGSLLLNTYVYKGANTFAIVDPGWPWTLDGLEAALAHLGLGTLEDVDAWLYTHTHVDHMGPAALLTKRSDAPHYAWRGVEEHLDDWHRFQDETNDWYDWSQEAFAEPARTMMHEWFEMRKNAPEPDGMVEEFGREARIENPRLLDFGESFAVGDLELAFLDARGHDPYHGAFFAPERSWLFAGDVALATPTPISRAMGDDLALYEASLDRLDALDADLLMPGHGAHRRDRSAKAFARSRGYITDYREKVSGLLQARDSAMDLYALGLAMTSDGKPLEPLARWWVHLSLIDSHLQQMVMNGDVEVLDGPRYRWR